jgi:hypothetical protein
MRLTGLKHLLPLAFLPFALLASADEDYQAAKWDPIHFQPAIDSATNEQCLECHLEILIRKPLKTSPAGVKRSDTQAWYQTLTSYAGEQESFHYRHLQSQLARQVMNLQCNFCHRGNDPREEAPASHADNQNDSGYNLRKMVDVEKTCLRCHGQYDYKVMNLPGPWHETRHMFNDSCTLCHQTIRTNRHKVSYLHPGNIEYLGNKDADICYGCHGGRAWYQTSFPYPRNSWQGISDDVPEWAKDRPTQSEARYRLDNTAEN